jgi:hypothetical protein
VGDPHQQRAEHALFDLMITASLGPGRDNRRPRLPVATIDVDVEINVIAVDDRVPPVQPGVDTCPRVGMRGAVAAGGARVTPSPTCLR